MADKLLSAESIPLISVVIGVGVVSFLLARACGGSSSAPSHQQEAPEQPPTEDKTKAKKKKKKKKASAKQETSDEEDQDVKVNKKESKKESKKEDNKTPVQKTPVQKTPEPAKEDQKLSKAQARRKRLKAKKAGDEQRKIYQEEKDKQLAAAKKAEDKATQQRVEKLIQQQKKAIDEDGYQPAPTRRSTGRVLRPSKDNEQLSTSRRDKKEPEPVRDSTSITVAVPVKSLGLIIGKEGKTIQEIQKRTVTQILTPKEKKSEGYEVPIKITGDAEGVALAKQAINDLLTKGFSSVIDPAAATGTVFLQNESQIGILIGPKGSVIQKFQKTLGVNIKVPSVGDRKLAVVISGPKEAVREARQSINDLLELGYSKILDPTWTHVDVPFPPAAHGRLIGTKGQNLKSIFGNTGCRVNIPKAGSDKKDFVTIVGPISAIESAKKQVLRWAEDRQEEPAPDPYDPFGEDEEENYDNEW